MTTDIKTTDEIVILKNNEEREEIIAKNGEFILDTFGPMKLKDIPNKFDYFYVTSDYGITNPQVFLLCRNKIHRRKTACMDTRWILQ